MGFFADLFSTPEERREREEERRQKEARDQEERARKEHLEGPYNRALLRLEMAVRLGSDVPLEVWEDLQTSVDRLHQPAAVAQTLFALLYESELSDERLEMRIRSYVNSLSPEGRLLLATWDGADDEVVAEVAKGLIFYMAGQVPGGFRQYSPDRARQYDYALTMVLGAVASWGDHDLGRSVNGYIRMLQTGRY